jgi:hypothetical protein
MPPARERTCSRLHARTQGKKVNSAVRVFAVKLVMNLISIGANQADFVRNRFVHKPINRKNHRLPVQREHVTAAVTAVKSVGDFSQADIFQLPGIRARSWGAPLRGWQ